MFMSNHLIGFGATQEEAASIALAGTVASTTISGLVTSHPLNMPSGITAGELLVMCAMLDRERPAPSGLAGWTQLFWVNTDPGLGLYYKTAAGGETLTLTYGVGLNASYAVLRITNWQGTPETTTTATGSSTAPNSGSISPSWGTASASFFISMASQFNTSSITTTGVPTNYTGPHPSTAGSGAMAYRVATASSEDPSAFTISSSASWAARTVAIRSL
jgi:hypothetical protein